MATKTPPKPKTAAEPADVRAPAPVGTAAPPGGRAGNLAVADLRPSPTNPRKSFPDESLEALANSIKAVGVRQRLLVRPVPAPNASAPRYDDTTRQWVGVDHFEVIAGERRLRAAKLAGLEVVPVDVCDLTDDQVLLVQLVENDQREDVRPSEQAAAYKRLADAGRTTEQIAADTGKSVGFVRGLLRLGKLPAWALAAVDADNLPRATAELVARVPGEESRKRAAACVLLGRIDPRDLRGTWNDDEEWEEAAANPTNQQEPLSYRDTRDLIRNHFTKELKGSPFSLKVLYVPADLVGTGHERHIQSCEECPKRAGNDAEAIADGTRADVCLDPDCYREKVEAYRAQEIAKHAEKGVEVLDTDERFAAGHAPKGYCDPMSMPWETELHADFPIGHKRRDEKLKDLLGKSELQKYLAFAGDGKPRTLVKTAEARKALIDARVLKKPEPRAKEEKSAPKPKADPHAAKKAVDLEHEANVRHAADLIAADRCRTMLLANAESLSEMGRAGGPDTDAVYQGLLLAVRLLVRDWLQVMDERTEVVKKYIPAITDSNRSKDRAAAKAAVGAMTPAELVGFFLAAAAHVAFTSPTDDPDLVAELYAYADTTAADCEAQARRELSPDKPAEDKAEAEAEQEKPAASDAIEPRGELISVLNLTEKQINLGRVVEHWTSKDIDEPVTVRAFKLDGNLYVWPGAVHRDGGTHWFCRPLLLPKAFAAAYPDIKPRVTAHGVTDSQALGYGTDCYAGVRVYCDGKERIIGPKAIERVLVAPPAPENLTDPATPKATKKASAAK